MVHSRQFKYGAQVDMGKDTDKIFRLHELHNTLFQMLQKEIGYNDDTQVAVHIIIKPDEYTKQYTGTVTSIPIYQQEIRMYNTNHNPYWYPDNRKLTVKERLQILFKGKL